MSEQRTPAVQTALDTADAAAAAMWTDVVALQQAHAEQADGRYRQVLATDDPTADLANALDEQSQPKSAPARAEVGGLGAEPDVAPPIVWQVNVYESSEGPGFELVAFADIDGQTWTRTLHQGPEARREQPWSPMLADDDGGEA